MPINRDDIIGERAVSGSTGLTCNHFEGFFSADRTITIRFDEADVTVLADGTAYYKQRSGSLEVVLSPPETTFALYNRRTGLPSGGGQTRSYQNLTDYIMSLYIGARAAASAQG